MWCGGPSSSCLHFSPSQTKFPDCQVPWGRSQGSPCSWTFLHSERLVQWGCGDTKAVCATAAVATSGHLWLWGRWPCPSCQAAGSHWEPLGAWPSSQALRPGQPPLPTRLTSGLVFCLSCLYFLSLSLMLLFIFTCYIYILRQHIHNRAVLPISLSAGSEPLLVHA